MALLRIEEAIGVVDGVNYTFFTTSAYVPNSVRYWLNGQLLLPDRLTEIDPLTGEVLLETTPALYVGDVVQFSWIDAASLAAEAARYVEVLRGTICPQVSLQGHWQDDTVMRGELREVERFSGRLVADRPLVGHVVETAPIRGTLRICEG